MTGQQPVALAQGGESNIYLVRGQKVMLSTHLAEIYEIEPMILDQTVRRNIECFPEGSIFQLSQEEFAGLKSQLATPCQAEPYAFTGQGVAMLSGILFDERAMRDDQESCAPACSCRK